MSQFPRIVLYVRQVSTYNRATRIIGNLPNKMKHNKGLTKQQENIKEGDVQSLASIELKARELLGDVASSKFTTCTHTSLNNICKLVNFLKKHRIARKTINRNHGIYHILKVYYASRDLEIQQQARVALALLGYVGPVKGRGVRILSLDGGGTRGIMTIEMLKVISERSGGKPIHEMFDLIIGTSTGAILAVLLGVEKYSLSRCAALYERLSREIFTARRLEGTARLLYKQSYYDTTGLERILKELLGDTHEMIDSAAYVGPKVAVLSTLMNYEQLKSFIFRNYHLPKEEDGKSFYRGSSEHKYWEAVRASTAAPGYFEEMVLGHRVHQDGGFLNNNPTAVAIHESKRLWPNTPFQAVVSLGTGTYHGNVGRYGTAKISDGHLSPKEKFKKLVYSATDVEATHEILSDLIPGDTYVRLNPNMSANIPLDVSDPEDLERLRQDTRNYVTKFDHKFELVVNALAKEKSVVDRAHDDLMLQKRLSFPSFSV